MYTQFILCCVHTAKSLRQAWHGRKKKAQASKKRQESNEQGGKKEIIIIFEEVKPGGSRGQRHIY